MVVMSRAIIDAFLFGSLEYIHLYNPRCRPDGEVVVLSHHILKRFLRSSLVIDFCSGHSSNETNYFSAILWVLARTHNNEHCSPKGEQGIHIKYVRDRR